MVIRRRTMLLRSASVAILAVLMATSTGATMAQDSVQTIPVGDAYVSLMEMDKFATPFIDIDEWRDEPVRHRYIHGGFKGTETRFSFYFPEADAYEGRFFQHVTPAPDSENLGPMLRGEFNKIGFALASGAYFVETNGGGSESEVTPYLANAAAAQYSRDVATAIYAGPRPYGYIYGGSGGGYRSIGSIENMQGVWDGAVPYVIGSSMALPNVFTVRLQAMRLLVRKMPQIVDALDPGGSGNPYKGMTEAEVAALSEVTRMGFPIRAWFGYKTMGIHGLAALYPGIVAADPEYFTDFWTKPGYAGHDDPDRYAADRVVLETTVQSLITQAEAVELGLVEAPDETLGGGVDNAFKSGVSADQIIGFRLADRPAKVSFLGGDLLIRSGALKANTLPLVSVIDDVVMLMNPGADQERLPNTGDQVTVDNSNFLALETYHRHQVPGPDFDGWAQFRSPDGTPVYPQRPLISPMFVSAASGAIPTGKFEGKMIVVASLFDREAYPWQADWYRRQVQANLGDDANDNFRLWFSENALHGDEPQLEDPARVVSYNGILQQALRDLAAWVEKGVEPPATTAYAVEEAQVVVSDEASARYGVQPLVSLSSGGSEIVEAKVGEPVVFEGLIEAVAGGGSVVDAEWDFNGDGIYDRADQLYGGASTETVTTAHTYAKPGTYFVTLRGTTKRDGNDETPFAKLQNLDRLRVIVSAKASD